MDSVGEEVSIREWEVEDADDICEIYSLITSTPVSADFKKMVLARTTKCGSDANFVAEVEGRIVGFIISYILPFGFGAEDCAYIATMGVHPKTMGQGVGVQMTKQLFDFYRKNGISRIYTSVRWDSTDLLSFFRTMSFDRSNFINLRLDLNRLPDDK